MTITKITKKGEANNARRKDQPIFATKKVDR